jgi:hypothetical protein
MLGYSKYPKRRADPMAEPSQPEFTWRKTALYVIATLIVSIILSIGMLVLRITLTSSLFQYTRLFFTLFGSVPALIVLIICVLKRPSGSRLWFVLLPLLYALFLCFYLALIGPSFYTDIECNSPTYSGLAVHQECICIVTGSSDIKQGNCSLDSLPVLPFARLTVH